MAKATPENIQFLRSAAEKLEQSNDYQWGHMGSCNCGFLAQEISSLTKAEIHSRAMQKYGDWNEQLNDYCGTSGLPMDDLISEMTSHGFSIEDLQNLERLADTQVLREAGVTHLEKNKKTDVVLYMKNWANLLENSLSIYTEMKSADTPDLSETYVDEVMESMKTTELVDSEA